MTQSQARFIRLNEIVSCKAFKHGWEQALLDPLECDIFGPDAFDTENKVNVNNYDADYYTSNENLKVDFAEELHMEGSSNEEDEDQIP